MAKITAALVKELREKTGAGMMDCKTALAETGGAVDGAVDWLRKKGLAAAAKKAGRVAAEGLVGVVVDGTRGALVEVNAETDFVARNDAFQDFVETVARVALAVDGDMSALLKAAYPGEDRTVEEQLTHNIATIGENISIRRAAIVEVSQGVVGSYAHNALKPGLGGIGVLVGVETDKDAKTIAKQVAMHIAAAKPLAVSSDDLDPAVVEKERAVLAAQARESGKPDNIVEKMVEGRISKFLGEICLVDQVFVIDGESKVGKAVEAAAPGAAVKGFAMFVLGEGVEKKEEDFAAEVAAAAGA